MTLLIITSVVLVIIIIGLIVRAQSLIDIVTGSAQKRAGFSNSFNALMFPAFLVFGFGAAIWTAIHASQYFLPEAASEHGIITDKLFWITMAVIGVVFFATHVLLFTFPFTYQYKENRKAYYYPDNHKLELIWTLIPAVVLSILVFTGLKAWTDITTTAPSNSTVVELVGKQFNWIVRYPGIDSKLGKHNYRKIDATNDAGIDFADRNGFDDFISNEVHLPKGVPVHLRIRARDVLHSVFMPHFRVKMDAVPGMPTQFWFTPTKSTEDMRTELGNPDFNFELACTEVCGRGHFGMRKLIIVHEPEDFQKWLREQESFLAKNPDYLKSVPEGLKKLAALQIKNPQAVKQVEEGEVVKTQASL